MDRIKYRMTGSSILDKFSSLKTSERKRKGSRDRLGSYQSLEELNRIQFIISRMPDHEANSKFEQMLDDMNLTEEKKAPLRQRTVAQKKSMLAMQCKGSIQNTMDTTNDFINELRRVPKMRGEERHEVVSSLRVALTNNPVSWMKDFAMKQGLNSVLKCLSYSCDDWDERKSTLECVKCLRAYSNNKFGLKQLIEHKDATTLLMRCLDTPHPSSRSSSSSTQSRSSSRTPSSSSSCNQAALEAVKLLAALSLVPPDGLSKVLEGASICGEMRGRPRFASVVEGLSSTDLQMKLACLQLINAVISTPDHLDFRLHLRNEIFRTGLCDVINSLEGHSNEEVQRQVRVLMEDKEEDAEEFSNRYDNIRFHMDDPRECFEVLFSSTLNTPSEDFFLSILQHLLSIREDLHARPQYYQLIEECVSQIVLHRSGIDPDFRCSRRFQLDVEPLLSKLREEGGGEDGEVHVGSRQLKGRLDEAVTARQELEARSTALEEKVKVYEAEIKELRLKLNMDIGSLIGSVIKAPPPPSTTPTNSATIPPPPPLPGLGPPPPPGCVPPPPPLAMLSAPRVPSFVKAKKKYQPGSQMKRANWSKINLSRLKKESFWSKAEEDKYADQQLLQQLEENFAFKNIEKHDEQDGEKQYRKAKELKVLDTRSAQNLSILLGSLKLPYEEIKRRILRMEDLSVTFVEQLLRLLPSQDIINKLASLKPHYHNLTEPEQFGVVISDVKRLLPRLSSMLFKMTFDQTLAETKPDIVAATEAMSEVVTSSKFGELLQLILLLGNFMNAGSRNECTVGFELSYIPKLVNTKSRDNSKSLMTFLVQQVLLKHPHLLSFPEDFIHLEQAAKVSLDSLTKSISGMKTSVKQLETDLKNARNDKQNTIPDDAFLSVMTPFLEVCKEQLEVLQGMHKSMEARYEQRVVPFYCLDPAKYPLDEFLSDVKLFVDHFELSRVELERQKELELMQKKQKKMEERWKEERKMKMLRKKMLVDIHADDDQEGVMDNLLEALKTGSAFQAGRRPARKRAARVAGAQRRAQLVQTGSRKSLLSPPCNLSRGHAPSTYSDTPMPSKPSPTTHATSKPSPATHATSKRSPTTHVTSKRSPTTHVTSKRSPTTHATSKPSPAIHSISKRSPTTRPSPNHSVSKTSHTKTSDTKASPKSTSSSKNTPSHFKHQTPSPSLNKSSNFSPRNATQPLKKKSPLHSTTPSKQRHKTPPSSHKASNIKTINFHDDEDDGDDGVNDENSNKFTVVQADHPGKNVNNPRKPFHQNSSSTNATNVTSASSSPHHPPSSLSSSHDPLTSYTPSNVGDFDDLLSQLRAL